jgi:hypothetical protein
VAVVAAKGDPEGLEEDLLSYTAEHLASFKRPKVIAIDSERLVEGRIDTDHIRAKYNDL